MKAAYVVLQNLWNKEYEVSLVTAAAVDVRFNKLHRRQGAVLTSGRVCCRASGQRYQGMRGNQQPCRW